MLAVPVKSNLFEMSASTRVIEKADWLDVKTSAFVQGVIVGGSMVHTADFKPQTSAI